MNCASSYSPHAAASDPRPFDDPDYLFELKHDGFRAIAYIENGDCRLVSRNLKSLRFAALERALAELLVKDAILDGEIVCIDWNGISQFNQLLSRKAEPILYAFDLLWLERPGLAVASTPRAQASPLCSPAIGPLYQGDLRATHRGRRKRVFSGDLREGPRGDRRETKTEHLQG